RLMWHSTDITTPETVIVIDNFNTLELLNTLLFTRIQSEFNCRKSPSIINNFTPCCVDERCELNSSKTT
ncbi:MAG: hypothetical protein KKC68_09375, partial [Candidatus Thermoplasmatota archaeon]|nr:hypothetical protein [Candidatus Thermoplasmatota archaeon]